MAQLFESNSTKISMTNYRKLSLEELQLFEKEFTEYLAINGINANYWQEIKQNDINKAEKIIDSFGEVIFNSILLKIEYIEFVTPHDIKYFYYGKEKAELIGLQSQEIDLSDNQKVIEAITNKEGKMSRYKTEKPYSQKREIELFTMLKNGCQPCDGKVFKLLKSID